MSVFKAFTEDSLRRKTMGQQFKLQIAPLSSKLKQLKSKMEDYMVQNELTTAFVKTPNKNPEVTYIQRVQKVQARRINRETIVEGLDAYFSEYGTKHHTWNTEEKTKHMWECINNARKVDKVVMSVLNKPVSQRKAKTGQYVHDATAELKATATQYWDVQRVIKAFKQAKKEKDKVLKERISKHSPSIINTMTSKKRKRQRINMNYNNTRCTFYIKIKESGKKPALKKEHFCKMILQSMPKSGNQQDFLNDLLRRFDTLPIVFEKRVTLDKGHYMPNTSTASTASDGTTIVADGGTTSTVAEAFSTAGDESVAPDGNDDAGTTDPTGV